MAWCLVFCGSTSSRSDILRVCYFFSEDCLRTEVWDCQTLSSQRLDLPVQLRYSRSCGGYVCLVLIYCGLCFGHDGCMHGRCKVGAGHPSDERHLRISSHPHQLALAMRPQL